MKNPKSLESRMSTRISRMKSSVILRKDFIDLGGYDQVGRVLRQLTQKGKILKVGYGIYAKAKVSSLTGETLPVQNLPTLAREALKRIGIEITPTKAELDYQTGRSTQIPTGRLIGVKKRITRKIAFNGASISYEHAS